MQRDDHDLHEEECRIIIRAQVLDIPGPVTVRAKTLGASFVRQKCGRALNWNPECETFDAIHLLEKQFSGNQIAAWFMYDLNVTDVRDKKQLPYIKHRVFQAHLEDDDL